MNEHLGAYALFRSVKAGRDPSPALRDRDKLSWPDGN